MKILLVRTSALGDIVHCLPVLQAIRRWRPEACIAWLVEAVWARLLEGHPDIDRLIHVRTKAWRKRPFAALTSGDMAQPVREMREFGADIAIDLMGNHKGAILARLSGAERVLGARAEDRREASSARWIKQPVAAVGVHAVDRALSLLRAVDPQIEIDASSVDFGRDRLLAGHEPSGLQAWLDQRHTGRPVITLLLGAGWANKIYPLERWGDVAAALDAAGHDVWLPTAPGEQAMAAAVEQASGGRARSVDATEFALLAAIFRRSRLVLGGDTGPLHLAHALGTPVLEIIGPTDPARNGPYGAPEGVIFQPLPCSYCYKRFDGPRACLLSIPSSRVVERALASLETRA